MVIIQVSGNNAQLTSQVQYGGERKHERKQTNTDSEFTNLYQGKSKEKSEKGQEEYGQIQYRQIQKHEMGARPVIRTERGEGYPL